MSDNIPKDLAWSIVGVTTKRDEDEGQAAQGTMLEEDDDMSPTFQTLRQFLSTCHNMNQAAHTLAGASCSSQSTTLAPEGKVYPQRIVSSPDFMEKQMEFWKLLLADNNSAFLRTMFPSIEHVHDTYFAVEPIDGEMTLCVFERMGVSSGVMTLLHQVLDDEVLRQAVGIGGHIAYGPLGGGSVAGAPDESGPQGNLSGPQRHSSFCVYSNPDNGRPAPAVAIEYRPSDLPMVQEIIAALESEIVPGRDVIGREDESFSFDSSSRQIVTATITQAFDCMVKLGVPYGYIYTGAAIIFLEIQDDPSVVHYFVSVPDTDVSVQDESTVYYSAVSQIFAFIIRAMQTGPCSMSWNDKTANLDVWKSAYDEVVMNMPLRLREPNSPPATYGEDDENDDDNENEHDSEHYDDCDVDIEDDTFMTIEIRMEITPDGHSAAPLDPDQQQAQVQAQVQAQEHTLPKSQQAQGGEAREKGEGEGEGEREGEESEQTGDDDDLLWIKNGRSTCSDVRKRIYCTQECLMGLTNGWPLDMACPNVHLHGDEHIDNIKFLKLVQDQLAEARGPSVGCVPLHLSGSIGVLFKVTLSSHGYTFVAKGVAESNAPRLCREGQMYSQLKEIQGGCIPVYLGIAQLNLPYLYKGGVFTHFMFLSWAGRPVREFCCWSGRDTFLRSAHRAYTELHNAGLLHRDPELRNMLYNPQQDRIMIVDFERSHFHRCHLTGFDGDDESNIEEEDGEYDDSSSSSSSSKDGLRRVNGSAHLHKEFENACERELVHATNLINCLIWGLRC
ncbi:hypothetical protein V8C37DRAFT_175726 [Trichoderma ceciliae]